MFVNIKHLVSPGVQKEKSMFENRGPKVRRIYSAKEDDPISIGLKSSII